MQPFLCIPATVHLPLHRHTANLSQVCRYSHLALVIVAAGIWFRDHVNSPMAVQPCGILAGRSRFKISYNFIGALRAYPVAITRAAGSGAEVFITPTTHFSIFVFHHGCTLTPQIVHVKKIMIRHKFLFLT